MTEGSDNQPLDKPLSSIPSEAVKAGLKLHKDVYDQSKGDQPTPEEKARSQKYRADMQTVSKKLQDLDSSESSLSAQEKSKQITASITPDLQESLDRGKALSAQSQDTASLSRQNREDLANYRMFKQWTGESDGSGIVSKHVDDYIDQKSNKSAVVNKEVDTKKQPNAVSGNENALETKKGGIGVAEQSTHRGNEYPDAGPDNKKIPVADGNAGAVTATRYHSTPDHDGANVVPVNGHAQRESYPTGEPNGMQSKIVRSTESLPQTESRGGFQRDNTGQVNRTADGAEGVVYAPRGSVAGQAESQSYRASMRETSAGGDRRDLTAPDRQSQHRTDKILSGQINAGDRSDPSAPSSRLRPDLIPPSSSQTSASLALRPDKSTGATRPEVSGTKLPAQELGDTGTRVETQRRDSGDKQANPAPGKTSPADAARPLVGKDAIAGSTALTKGTPDVSQRQVSAPTPDSLKRDQSRVETARTTVKSDAINKTPARAALDSVVTRGTSADRRDSPALRAVIRVTLPPERAGRAGESANATPRSVDLSIKARITPLDRSERIPQAAREPNTFTSATRLPERRYILGSEIALAAVIAAVGAARVRPESTAVRAGIQVQPERQATDGKAPTRVGPAADVSGTGDRVGVRNAGRSFDDARSFTTSSRVPDRHYFPGAEIALVAVIASAGAARVRVDGRSPDERADFRQMPVDKHQEHLGERRGDQIAALIASIRRSFAPAQKEGDRLVALRPEHPEPIDTAPIVSSTVKEPAEKTQSRFSNRKGPGRTHDKAETEETEEIQPAEKTIIVSAEPKKILHRPTTLVAAGSTLVSIAEAFFHDPNLGWLIADLNQGDSKQNWVDGKRVVELKVRQEIVLPVWEDINEFYSQRAPDAKPENLITIVEETQLNTEILDLALGAVMGSGAGRSPASLNPVPTSTRQSLEPEILEFPPIPATVARIRAMVARVPVAIATIFDRKQWSKPPAVLAERPIERYLRNPRRI